MTSHEPRFETLAVHAGAEPDGESGALAPAIVLASTFAQDAVGRPRDLRRSRRPSAWYCRKEQRAPHRSSIAGRPADFSDASRGRLIFASGTDALVGGMDISGRAIPLRPPVPGAGVDTGAQDPASRMASCRGPDALRAALAILADQMNEAVARRRASAPATEPFRRADARVAYLAELFRQLQQRMVIPDAVWGLGAPALRMEASAGEAHRPRRRGFSAGTHL
jgi:hypothetical protein